MTAQLRDAHGYLFSVLHLLVIGLILYFPAVAQTVAFLTPDMAVSSKSLAEKLKDRVDPKLKVLDDSLAESAYLSVSPATPFNLTTHEAKRIGAVIGCEVFILVRSATQRRSAFQRAEYYESFATIYVVSSRTGKLVYWKLQQAEAESGDKSAGLLDLSLGRLLPDIETAIRRAARPEPEVGKPPFVEEFPDEKSQAATATKAPVPYRRFKPQYTRQAALFDVKATVDLNVYLDEKGSVIYTEAERWAGFGLDEAVENNVRSMNWRPAERGGKPFAVKFLVRYNFKKLE